MTADVIYITENINYHKIYINYFCEYILQSGTYVNLCQAARSASATTRPPARCHDHDGPDSLLPLRTVAHDAHQPARTLWSATAPRARPPLAGRRASLPRRRVGGGGCSASTDASALGPAAPGTQSAAYTAAMGLRAVPDGGYAASTPIWLLAVGRGHHCTVGRCSGRQAARAARRATACMAFQEGGRTFFLH